MSITGMLPMPMKAQAEKQTLLHAGNIQGATPPPRPHIATTLTKLQAQQIAGCTAEVHAHVVRPISTAAESSDLPNSSRGQQQPCYHFCYPSGGARQGPDQSSNEAQVNTMDVQCTHESIN